MALLRESVGTSASHNSRMPLVSWLLILSLLLSVSLDRRTESAGATEYQLKAVFLFNFAQFVEWPTSAFPGKQTPLVIGVLGADPFGGYLDETVRGERVNNRSFLIERYRRVDEIGTCHVLFISQSEIGRIPQIVATLKDRNILTVADVEGVTRRGVIIGFVTEQNKIRLRVNLAAAKAANLTISSKLLRLADTGKD
jgi:YfiR/HmsC-like